MASERFVDADLVEASLAGPIVGAGPVCADGYPDCERGQTVVEPLMEVVGVEHEQHVGIDVIDMRTNGDERAGHEGLWVGRAVAR